MSRDEALARIDEVYGWEENWDSFGGKPVTAAAYKAARSLMDAMTDDFNFPGPRRISPTKDGGLVFWWNADAPAFESTLEIGVRPDGTKYVANCRFDPIRNEFLD
jgi:hypothetical protein